MRRNDPRLWSTSLQLSVVTLALMTGLSRSYALTDATTECLVGFTGVPDGVKNGGTLEGVSSGGGSCTFNLQLCANQTVSPCVASQLRRVKAIGKCRGTSSLKFLPSGDSAMRSQPPS